MVSVLVVAITCIKFEFTDDANVQLFAGESIYGKMYIHTYYKPVVTVQLMSTSPWQFTLEHNNSVGV